MSNDELTDIDEFDSEERFEIDADPLANESEDDTALEKLDQEQGITRSMLGSLTSMSSMHTVSSTSNAMLFFSFLKLHDV